VDNSLLRETANFWIIKMKLVYPVSSIKDAVNHLLLVGPLKHQEDSSKKKCSRIAGKSKFEDDASYLI